MEEPNYGENNDNNIQGVDNNAMKNGMKFMALEEPMYGENEVGVFYTYDDNGIIKYYGTFQYEDGYVMLMNNFGNRSYQRTKNEKAFITKKQFDILNRMQRYLSDNENRNIRDDLPAIRTAINAVQPWWKFWGGNRRSRRRLKKKRGSRRKI
jgi:hypothetical protein